MKHTRGSSRLLSLLLAVAMVAGLFAGLTLTASAADADIVWEDGKVISEPMDLDGSQYTAEKPLTVQVKGTRIAVTNSSGSSISVALSFVVKKSRALMLFLLVMISASNAISTGEISEALTE